MGGRVTITWEPWQHLAVAQHDPHLVLVLLHGADRCVQPDPIPELARHGLADADGPAHDPVLLRAAIHREQGLEVGPGAGVEQRVQRRQVRRLGREHGLAGDAEVGPPGGGAQRATDPGLEGLAVELASTIGGPRLVERDRRRQLGEPGHALGQVRQGERAELGDRAPVALHPAGLAPELHDELALVPGGERLQTQLVDQLVHPGLGGPDPLAAQLDGRAVHGDCRLPCVRPPGRGPPAPPRRGRRPRGAGPPPVRPAQHRPPGPGGRSQVCRLVEPPPLLLHPSGPPIGVSGGPQAVEPALLQVLGQGEGLGAGRRIGQPASLRPVPLGARTARGP